MALFDKDPAPVFPDDIKEKINSAVAGIKEGSKDEVRSSGLEAAYVQHEEKDKNPDPGKWSEYGLTREQASTAAMNAIKTELGSLAASDHQHWDSALEAMMLQGSGDPSKLWATYRNLVQADNRLEEKDGTLGDVHPDNTPAVATVSKDKSQGIA